MELPMTPPQQEAMEIDYFSSKRRRAVTEDEDEDEERINQLLDSYAPLSNLPTPPLSGETSPFQSIAMSYESHADAPLKVPAKFLSHLVRREAGGHRPSVDRITSFLKLSGMAETIIAFAGCILDRLSWRFVREWKKAFDAAQETPDPTRHWWYVRPMARKPEVIVLAALSLASGWMDDFSRSNRFWVEDVGEGQHSRKELALTQRCILQDENIDYALLCIDAEEVEAMLREMYEFDALPLGLESKAEDASLATHLKQPAVLMEGLPTPKTTPPNIEI